MSAPVVPREIHPEFGEPHDERIEVRYVRRLRKAARKVYVVRGSRIEHRYYNTAVAELRRLEASA